MIIALYYKVRDVFQGINILSNTYVLVSHCCVTNITKIYWCKTVSTISHLDTCYPVEMVLLQPWGLSLVYIPHILGPRMGSVALQGRIFPYQRLETSRGKHGNKRCLLRSRLGTGTISFLSTFYWLHQVTQQRSTSATPHHHL